MPESSLKRLMAFDYGRKRIGVAVGQTLTKTATPLPHLRAGNRGMPEWSVVQKLLKEWQITDIIVGIPLNMDGSEQTMTLHARAFVQELKTRFKIPTHEVDERLTTKAVRAELYEQGGFSAIKKADIDSLAAVLLLQQWMSHHEQQS